MDPHTPPSVAALTGLAVMLAGTGSFFLVPVGDVLTVNVLFAGTLLFTLFSIGLSFRLMFTGFYRQIEVNRWTGVDVETLKVRLVRRLVAGFAVAVATPPLVGGIGGVLWRFFGDSWGSAIGLGIVVTAPVLAYSALLTNILRLDREIRRRGRFPGSRPD